MKDEQVQDWGEKQLFLQLKRLLEEKRNNNEIEDWIQVTHDEITFKRNLHVETMTKGMNNLIIPLFFLPPEQHQCQTEVIGRVGESFDEISLRVSHCWL